MRIRVTRCLWLVAALALVSSCGGGGGQCAGAGGLTAEPAPRQVALDGGVPIDQLANALAVARCNYWSRCFGLATYVANECVDAVANAGTWSYQVCGRVGPQTECTTSTITYNLPSPALTAAVVNGVVQYDAQREGQCIAALLAEGCNSDQLLEDIPSCAGVFTCPAGSDGGGGGTADGGASDGGSQCAAFVSDSDPIPACATDDDCAGVTGYPEGPHCIGGICTASPCGLFSDDRCVSFAGEGQPCQGDAVSILSDQAETPTETCAPGLVCQGATVDGGLGTCVVPQDVGGACTLGSNCKAGLVCGCGACEIPPSIGPCVAGTCEMGVAYCDFDTNTCRPGQRPPI